jgi:hypothetical protein
MATAGVIVVPADLLGWLDKLAPGGTLQKITLLILSTVTLFLLLEVDRLKVLDSMSSQLSSLVEEVGRLRVLDNMNSQLSKLDIDRIAREMCQEHYLGVVEVHRTFPAQKFTRFVENAVQEVTILQTWMPNLELLEEAELLKKAIDRGVQVRILLLHPASGVAQLREQALRIDPDMMDNVQESVKGCLRRLARLYKGVQEEGRTRLQVRVYSSLPSIAVYKVDEHYLVSSFLHGRLAIHSTQIEIDGCDTGMGEEVQRELDKLWGIGRDVDLGDWRSVDDINL